MSGWEFIRRFFGAASAIFVLVALYKFGLIDISKLESAFRKYPDFMLASIVCAVGSSALSAIRQKLALSLLDVSVSWRSAASASLLGQGIGAWMPASAAVTEALRIGILLGSDRQLRDEMAPRAALASLIDRVVGLGVMFLAGSIAAASLAIAPAGAHSLIMALAAAMNLVVGVILVAAPFAAPTRLFRWTAEFWSAITGHLPHKIRHWAAAGFAHLAKASELLGSRSAGMFALIALSLAVVVLSCVPTYLALAAVGAQVPFQVVLAASPMTVVSILLPTGMAGFGGPQVVAALVFAPFGVPAAAIVTASLIQNTLVMAVQSLLAAGSVLFGAVLPRKSVAIPR